MIEYEHLAAFGGPLDGETVKIAKGSKRFEYLIIPEAPKTAPLLPSSGVREDDAVLHKVQYVRCRVPGGEAFVLDEKGVKNGKCNRSACQRLKAVFYNSSTRAWYCPSCAREINDASPGLCYVPREGDEPYVS